MLAYAEGATSFSGSLDFFQPSLDAGKQDNYTYDYVVLDRLDKDKPLNFTSNTDSFRAGALYFDYPDDQDNPANLYFRDIAQAYPYQNSRLYKMIPKDLMPYLGLRVKYNLTDRVALINDITPNNIVYSLTYMY